MATSPERAFNLQKYLLLHSQHDALQKHLLSISEDANSSPSTSPPDHNTYMTQAPTPAVAPSRAHQRSASTSIALSKGPESFGFRTSPPPSRPGLLKRRSSMPTTLATVDEVRLDEEKLLNVNQQIKTTLTELLNCETVKCDRSYRMWIQSRLMDAERELKVGRSHRRQSVDIQGRERAVI